MRRRLVAVEAQHLAAVEAATRPLDPPVAPSPAGRAYKVGRPTRCGERTNVATLRSGEWC